MRASISIIAVVLVWLLPGDSRADELPRLTAPITCKPNICQEAAEYLARGQDAQALDAYDYIVTSVETPRRSLLHFLLASLHLRQNHPDEAMRSLVRYRDFIRDIADDQLPVGQRRADIDALEKQISLALDRTRGGTAANPGTTSARAMWRLPVGAVGLTLGVAGVIAGAALTGLAGRCLDLSNQCTDVLAKVPNTAIGVTLMITGAAAGVGGGLLIWLPPQRHQ